MVHRTPVLTSGQLDQAAGARVFAKCESLQRTGSFKFRGASNAVRSLARATEVACHSSGNHGAALARAARDHGAVAHVVMPTSAPAVKRAAVAGYGGRIVDCEPTLAAREATLARVVAETGAVEVHPYDDDRVIAGQGTAALELLEEAPDLDLVLVPVGGGGLIAGTAAAVKGRSPGTRVVGVEPAAAADAQASLRAGRRIPLPAAPATIADGVRSLCVGERPFEVIRRLVDDIVTVTDDQLLDALALCWSRTKQLVEPTAALPLAALQTGAARGRRVGVVLTGGNVDTATLVSCLV